MVLKIVQIGEQVLRKPARALAWEEIQTAEIQRLIADMRDTMQDAPGVGLAAPQIGQSLQIAVIEDLEKYHKELTPQQLTERGRRPVPFHVLINPRIVSKSHPNQCFLEGCLSFSGFGALVERSQSVVVEFLNEYAQEKRVEAEGWYARILQHEIDHLQGRLYIDRMDARTLTTLENYKRYWKDATPEEMKSRLGGS